MKETIMKTTKIITIVLAAVLTLSGCQKDPLAEVNEGKWNKERNIIGITFNGQIGDAIISRDGDIATIDFKYNTAAGELSAVKLNGIEVSYGASASVSVGQTLNFDNTSSSAIITITSAQGKTLDWVVTLTPFTETLLGTWKISGLIVYGGTGPEYGGAAVIKMTDKSWCWNTTTGPAAEQDNSLTFTLDGFTDDGNSYGKVVNNAGNDGLYADFIFTSSDPDVDVNRFYRKIPTGEGSWLRNYSTGLVTFTFANGTTTSGTFVSAGTETLYGSITKTTVDHSISFTLSGVDDWSNIYKDYDKFVSRPRKFWVDITKVK
ncbi:MAG TPA: hypothetical protein PKH02_00575 [Bacteroidales bacterium]|nr:hypothetical protein [Bacteroidales bacterium]HPT11045.1 hypothetical protein [Bacteroidales bacterium]